VSKQQAKQKAKPKAQGRGGRASYQGRQGLRADELLVARGLAPDVRKAQALIMAGEVIVGERRLEQAGARLPLDVAIRMRPRRGHGYVGRGGLKMEWALDHFQVDPQGWVCLDLGLSTGGFSDCLLQRGAQRVYGVDVGVGLAHERLTRDPRMVIHEGLHAKSLTREHIPEPCDLCVADISFNSLTRLIEPALPFMKPKGWLLLLIKPQFELSEAELERSAERGIVHDIDAQALACERVATHLTDLGVMVSSWAPCGVKGTKGNQEYFMLAQPQEAD